MDMLDIIKSRRSIRLFDQRPVSRTTLIELLEAARSAPSAANRQPCEYIIVDEPKTCGKLFEHLAWAGYVKPKRNPPAGKQPVAYIVVLTDPAKSPERACLGDAAAAIENILLAAWSLEVGSCWLGAINRDEIKKLLAIRSELYIDSVLAFGYPAENPIMEEAKAGSTQYYLDENDTLHVPKRPVSEIAHFNAYGRK